MAKKEGQNAWRELIRKPEGLSWRDRERMWGGLVGGALILAASFFLWGRSATRGETAGLSLGFFALGVSVLAVSVSTFLIYHRKLTDKSLFWAGIVNRVGQIGLGLSLLLLYPWERMAQGRASFVEGVVLCAGALAYAVGLGLVPLIRLVRAYRHKDWETQREARQEGPRKKGPARFGFWALGLLLLAVFSACLLLELQYQKTEKEYEELRWQSIELRLGQRKETEFDEERYAEVSDAYHTMHRWARGGRYNAESGLIVSGFGLLFWVLTLAGRLISRAAWRSVERDERREQRKLEKEQARQRSRDPWE